MNKKLSVLAVVLVVLVGVIVAGAVTDNLGVGFTLVKSAAVSVTDGLTTTFTLIKSAVSFASDGLTTTFTLVKSAAVAVTDGLTTTFTLIKSGIVTAFDNIVSVFTLEKEEVIPPITTACNPYSPNPPNGVSNIPITTNLTWQCDSEGINFDIYFGVCSYDPPTKVVSNQSSNVYNPVLQPNTCYCWRVISYGTNDTSISGKYWQFSTLANVELFVKDYVGVWENYSMYNKGDEGCYQGESINMSGLTSAIPAFYTGAVGSLFWLFMFGLPFVAIWIKSESVIIPTLLGFLISGSMFFFLPIEYQGAAQILFYISLAGLLFSFFKSRY